jgi:hypothetical protein
MLFSLSCCKDSAICANNKTKRAQKRMGRGFFSKKQMGQRALQSITIPFIGRSE